MQIIEVKKAEVQLPEEFIKEYQNFPVPWGPLGYVTYKRTYARPIIPSYLEHIDSYHDQLKQWRKMTGNPNAVFKTEEWWQTTARCVNWYLKMAKGAVSVEEGMALFDDIMHLRCSFSGRGLWQCGTKTVETLGQSSLNNCYFVNIDSIESFLFTFDMLMLGGGVGFNIQKEFVFELPKIVKGRVVRKEGNDADFIVPDSREGWVELLRRVLESYFTTGKSFSFSTVCIRPAGSPIAGFGGVASGPEPLCTGIDQITTIFDNRVGKKLRPIDCLDILNIIGSIVVAGNVRRSAEIALGDHEDTYFLEAKRFDLSAAVPNWRAMSNNSVACSHYTYLSDKFWKTYEVGGEPYGLVNLKLCREKGRLKDTHRKDTNVTGVNPCHVGSSYLLTSEGYRTFEELYQSGAEVSVVQDKRVSYVGPIEDNNNPQYWKIDAKEQGCEINKASHVFLTKKNAPTVIVNFASGLSMQCTPDHHIATKNRGMVEAQHLTATDVVLVAETPIHDITAINELSDEFRLGFLYGLFVGDGTRSYKDNEISRLHICLWNQDCAFADKIVEEIEYFYAKENELLTWADHTGSRTITSCYLTTEDTKTSIVSTFLARLFAKYGLLSPAKECKFSTNVLKNENIFAGFMSGLFFSDGTVGGGYGEDYDAGLSLRIASSEPQMLKDIQRKLLEFGCHSRVYQRREAQQRMMPDGKNGLKEYQCRADYELIVGGISRDRFASIAKLIGHKAERYAELRSFYKKANQNFWTRVESVTEGDHQDVYCIREDTRRTIVVNGITNRRCGEITLESGESCNLAEIYFPNITSKEQLLEVAARIWKVCKVVACVPHNWEFANKVISKNLRTGLGLTGVFQKDMSRVQEWSDAAYSHLEEVDKTFSKQLTDTYGKKINTSIKLTTVKPSGTLSLLAGVSPGIHPEYASFYIRRIRVASNSPIVDSCRKAGYPVEPVLRFDGTKDLGTVVVEFPVMARPGAVVAKEVTAIQQLEAAKVMQTYWSDNSVSVTVYYRKEELPAIKEWLAANYDTGVKTISFLLHSEHGFVQAPYEEITEKEYEKRVRHLEPLDLSGSHDEMYDTSDCAGNACPTR